MRSHSEPGPGLYETSFFACLCPIQRSPRAPQVHVMICNFAISFVIVIDDYPRFKDHLEPGDHGVHEMNALFVAEVRKILVGQHEDLPLCSCACVLSLIHI